MSLKVANAAGFLGDRLSAARRLVDAAEVDYLTLEHLAELTLSILARIREKNPQAGYANDFLEVLATLAEPLQQQSQLRVVTNAGGMNPLACAIQAGRLLQEAGLGALPIAAVTGDDLAPRLAELQAAGHLLRHFDTGQPLAELGLPVVSANAYLGAEPIAAGLGEQARLVITGRVADAALTLGPCLHRFGWSLQDWNRLAGGSVAGHLIECGAQATGGYAVDWAEYDLTDVGYPIAEIEASGDCVITKPPGAGGVVNRRTVVEQLVYEIGDPQHYLTPDVDVDFSAVEVAEMGPDRVRVSGARGQAPPDSYKVSLSYRAGYMASAQLLVYGEDCLAKAERCAAMIFARTAQAGYTLERMHWERLGAGDGVPGVAFAGRPPEVVLRVAAQDSRREAVECFTREIAPLITSGPAGLAGYASGRSPVRPVFAFWPTTIPRSAAVAAVVTRTASDWAER
ncbi:acyclic terpene utilization AtuA family protein [Lignipirellula cremea]|uniref:Acyclic terpene utilisation N-terminal domain-containing protein n=1 Tax=Lignipirellula cremea TaxID=2528010 RepID=A0A518DSL6_9BACT|nr:acyclic terpene utilization AtuA family protein [Lignipirellula cremea]QDU94833.1 hypothetical protein Pla8534_26410 [Lignipirellula cremea]